MSEQAGTQSWPVEKEIPSSYCDDASNLNVKVAGNLVTFTWEAPHDNDGFYLKYWIDGQTPVMTTIFGQSVQFALTENKDYNWSVRTMCDRVNDRGSEEVVGVSFKTGTALPVCPSINISAALLIKAGSTVRAEWTNVVLAKQYNVQIREKGSIVEPVIYPTLTNSFTFTLLAPNTVYQWRVEPICLDLESNYSEWAEFETGASAVCDSPNPNVIVDISSCVSVWPPVASSYQIFLNGTILNKEHPVNVLTLTHLKPDTEYTLLYVSNCEAGNSDIVAVTFKTLPARLAEPQNVTWSIEDNVININWKSPGNMTNFEIVVHGNIYIVDGNISSFSIDARDNNKVNFLIKSVKGELKSEGVYFKVNVPPRLGKIQSLLPVWVKHNAIRLQWHLPAGTHHFKVSYRKEGSGISNDFVTDRTIFSFTGLLHATNYVFTVTPVGMDNKEGIATSNTLLTAATPLCSIPVIKNIFNITSNSFSVVFDAERETGIFKLIVFLGDVEVNTFESEENTITATGLNPDTGYTFVVENHCGLIPSATPLTLVETKKLCEPVPNLEAEFINDNLDIEVNWDAVSNASEYQVYKRRVWETEWVLVGVTPFNTITFASKYEMCEIEVITKYGDYRECSSKTFPAIPAITDLSYEASGRDVNFTWQGIKGLHAYRLIIESLTETLKIDSLSFSKKVKLELDTTYSVSVAGFFNDEYGPYNTPDPFTTGTDETQPASDCIKPDFNTLSQDSHINDEAMPAGTKLDIAIDIKNYAPEFVYEVRLINEGASIPVQVRRLEEGITDDGTMVKFLQVPTGSYTIHVISYRNEAKYCEDYSAVEPL